MIHDVIGVGFGPSNIALAIALEESHSSLNALFLERGSAALWHEGMLLDGSDVQHNLLRDLVTPVNPRSQYSFVNYLHASGRFFEFLNLGRPYALRRDFFNYVRWAADQFSNVIYDVDVVQLQHEEVDGVPVWAVRTRTGATYWARALVLGTGRNLNIPQGLEESETVVHLSRYRNAIEKVPTTAHVAVLGSSQSAVELLLDLRGRGFERVHAVHRSFSFRLKDTSPFSDEVYFPEFIDYYHSLPPEKRALLDEQTRQTNYSCADGDVIDALYCKLYEDRLKGSERVSLHRNHEIARLTPGAPMELELRDIYTRASRTLQVQLLILATGFLDVGRNGREGLPAILRDKASLFSWDGRYLDVERQYRVRYSEQAGDLPDLYLNGLCESSHGLGDAGSFSLVSVRAREILNSVTQRRFKHESGIYDLRRAEEAVRASRSAGVR
jgi:L-ornithine N5-oxygenase